MAISLVYADGAGIKAMRIGPGCPTAGGLRSIKHFADFRRVFSCVLLE